MAAMLDMSEATMMSSYSCSPFFLPLSQDQPLITNTTCHESFSSLPSSYHINTFNGGHEVLSFPPDISSIQTCGNNDMKRQKVDAGLKIGFRTKSEVEILDDGFKWRKYGKKSVKNSPNPRNYYRCSSEGCGVKKRVERDPENSEYVITVYEGVHNHESPANVSVQEMNTSWSSSPDQIYAFDAYSKCF
ncbi:putative transcription factor WRKY family [Dioscorea sansibarensis]